MLERLVAVGENAFAEQLHRLVLADYAALLFQDRIYMLISVLPSAVVIVAAGRQEIICQLQISVIVIGPDDVRFVINIFENRGVSRFVGKLIVIVNSGSNGQVVAAML